MLTFAAVGDDPLAQAASALSALAAPETVPVVGRIPEQINMVRGALAAYEARGPDPGSACLILAIWRCGRTLVAAAVHNHGAEATRWVIRDVDVESGLSTAHRRQ